MNKCKSCDHVKVVNEQVIYCPYFRCVKENGWIADIRRGVNDNRAHTTEEDRTITLGGGN